MQAHKVAATLFSVGIVESTGGIVTGCSEVIVERSSEHEWIAISRQPATVGATLLLEVHEGGAVQLAMCVIESRSMVLDGDARYWIRMHATALLPVLFEQQIRRG